jgi:hypothetical protein
MMLLYLIFLMALNAVALVTEHFRYVIHHGSCAWDDLP